MLGGLFYAFNPLTFFADPDQKVTATILSIDSVHRVDRYSRVAKLSVTLSDGEAVTAFGLTKHLSYCSTGDRVSVRMIQFEKEANNFYRLVSDSCTKPDIGPHW
ncbi:MAG: hypothetical protein Pars92KO_20530 [Parasphingorhabdus sp.]